MGAVGVRLASSGLSPLESCRRLKLMKHLNPSRLFYIALLISVVSIGVFACSGPSPVYDTGESKVKPGTPTPTPTPTPEEKKVKWVCRLMNGEGRTFQGEDETAFRAQLRARHDCELVSRHCTLLGCNPEEVDPK